MPKSSPTQQAAQAALIAGAGLLYTFLVVLYGLFGPPRHGASSQCPPVPQAESLFGAATLPPLKPATVTELQLCTIPTAEVIRPAATFGTSATPR